MLQQVSWCQQDPPTTGAIVCVNWFLQVSVEGRGEGMEVEVEVAVGWIDSG